MRKFRLTNTRGGYGLVAILLHWLIAVLVFAQLGLGLVMTRVSDQRLMFELIQRHKSIGVLILVLIVLRLVWRIANPRPRPVSSLQPWEKRASSLLHRVLYGLLLALPLSGWAMVSASVLGIPTLVFGIFLLPHLPVTVSEASEDFWRLLHHFLAYTVLTLIAGHVLAALRHHFILKNEVLRRMLRPPRTKP